MAFIFSLCQATIGHTLVPTLGADIVIAHEHGACWQPAFLLRVDIARTSMELAGNRSLQPRSLGQSGRGLYYLPLAPQTRLRSWISSLSTAQ